MNILLVSANFPPEVNAPASRAWEHSKCWVKKGDCVEILTAVPSYPEGKVYSGFLNKWSQIQEEGITVDRVPIYPSENKGTFKRILGYLSFMSSAMIHSFKLQNKPDVVIASSPQLFSAVAGYMIAKKFRVPFVLEIRDLWPESIEAVGAVPSFTLAFFYKLAFFLYKHANQIVVVTKSFKHEICAKGIDESKIHIIKNGADLEFWRQEENEDVLTPLLEKYQIHDEFIVAYIGTIGMAHRADILYEVAKEDIHQKTLYLVVGAGAEFDKLQQKQKLKNFRLIPKISKKEVRQLLKRIEVCLIHLKKASLFETVIPSKMFEAMAVGKPIILGVRGEAQDMLIESEAGICIEPESIAELSNAVQEMRNHEELRKQYGKNGKNYVKKYYSRVQLAEEYRLLLYHTIKH